MLAVQPTDKVLYDAGTHPAGWDGRIKETRQTVQRLCRQEKPSLDNGSSYTSITHAWINMPNAHGISESRNGPQHLKSRNGHSNGLGLAVADADVNLLDSSLLCSRGGVTMQLHTG